MRQAGRYLPGYRRIRASKSIVDVIKDPRLAVEVVTEPVEAFNFDAAIVFSDIILPLQGMGVDVKLEEGVGPVLEKGFKPSAVDKISEGNPEEDMGYVLEQIEVFKQSHNVPLIGFSGAPFTLASYIVEGGYSRGFSETKRFMFERTEKWFELMSKLTSNTAKYLNSQIRAGVDAVQLFDSWVGALSPADYAEYVEPFNTRLANSVKGVPRIYFGTESAGLLHRLRQLDFEVVGVDWRSEISAAWRVLGDGKAVQGNLDPAALLGGKAHALRRTKEILDSVKGRVGHIFNLGHGVLPSTEPAVVEEVVKFIHEYTLEHASKVNEDE